MPPRAMEDLLQLAFDRIEGLLAMVSGGAREHRALTVSTGYAAATNSASFGSPKKHLSIFAASDSHSHFFYLRL